MFDPWPLATFLASLPIILLPHHVPATRASLLSLEYPEAVITPGTAPSPWKDSAQTSLLIAHSKQQSPLSSMPSYSFSFPLHTHH